MLDLAVERLNAHRRFQGMCQGAEVHGGIKKSVAMPRIQAMVTGKALTCYVASYLGCSDGDWIVASSRVVNVRGPFTRAKVTIIEQTAERVVADVAEVPVEDLAYLTARVVEGDDDDEGRPYTDAEVAAVKHRSRYTITRGSDGVWRISDRVPSFKWICEESSVQPLRK